MCVPELSPKVLRDKLATLEMIQKTLKPYLITAGVEKEKIGPNWWRFEPDWNVG
jgi:hypothetical protein